MDLSLLITLQNIELLIGLPRNYFRIKSKCVKVLILVQSASVILISVLSFFFQQMYIVSDIPQENIRIIWTISLANQFIESIINVICNYAYSNRYYKLVQNIKSLIKAFPEVTISIHIKTLKYLLILELLAGMGVLLLDAFYVFTPIINIMPFLLSFLIISWYYSLLIHSILSALCSTIYIVISSIINCFTIRIMKLNSQLLENDEFEHLIKFNKDINKVCRGYSEIIEICNDCNTIFGIQVNYKISVIEIRFIAAVA